MAFPLGAVLAAAPGVLSAAADIIRVIREKKSRPTQTQPDSEKLDELAALIERQAQVIEELALNNSNLALAVRNNRILSTISIVIAMGVMLFAVMRG